MEYQGWTLPEYGQQGTLPGRVEGELAKESEQNGKGKLATNIGFWGKSDSGGHPLRFVMGLPSGGKASVQPVDDKGEEGLKIAACPRSVALL